MTSLSEVGHWKNNSFLLWSVLLRWKGQISHVVLPGWGQLGAGINYIRDSQSVVRGLVSSIIYAVRWQHTCFSFWHKLIIWYWINNYSIEYKPDVTSLVSHWKQWISPRALGRFSEDEVDGLGPSVVNALKKWSLDQRIFTILELVLLWLWFSVKWPTKQKCCGPAVDKPLQTWGVGF